MSSVETQVLKAVNDVVTLTKQAASSADAASGNSVKAAAAATDAATSKMAASASAATAASAAAAAAATAAAATIAAASTPTPTANKIPIAGNDGKLDAGWLPSSGGGGPVAGVVINSDGTVAHQFGLVATRVRDGTQTLDLDAPLPFGTYVACVTLYNVKHGGTGNQDWSYSLSLASDTQIQLETARASFGDADVAVSVLFFSIV